MHRAFAVFLFLICLPLMAQEIPAPTELMGEPFFIKKKWLIEPDNHQDYHAGDKLEYLALDPRALQLFISHGPRIEIVDITTGALEARVTGVKDARSIVLESTGQFGYIADSAASTIAVLDRGAQQIADRIPSCVGGRSLALEPQSALLFEICGAVESAPAPPHRDAASAAQRSRAPSAKANSGNPPESVSYIAIVDAESRKALAIQPIEGKLGFAQADGNGGIYITFDDRNGLLRVDAVTLGGILRGDRRAPGEAVRLGAWNPVSQSSDPGVGEEASAPTLGHSALRYVHLGDQCNPRALAADGAHLRLFIACDDAKLLVTNAQNGQLMASLPTGPGTDDVGYDPNQRLVFVANGGNAGSLTIIHQHNTDSYHVVQNLPTSHGARTLAVDEASGWVYLVTPFLGVNPAQAMNSGKLDPAGNFEVLAIGK